MSRWFVPILIVFLLLFLRLPKLTNIPVFVDEAIYIRWSQIMKAETTLRFLPSSDGKPPLFMWLTMPSFKLFDDPLLAGRMVSVGAGIFSALGISLLGYVLTKKVSVGLFAGLLYSITPYFVFFDRMALVDSLLTTFGIYSLLFGYLFLKTKRIDYALFLGFSLGGGLLTKAPAVFFYLWQLVLLTSLFLNKKIDFKKGTVVRILFGWFLAIAVSQVMFNILRLGPNFHLLNARNYDYVFPFKEVLSHPLNPLDRNLNLTSDWLLRLLTPSLLALALLSFFGQYRALGFTLLTLFLVPTLGQGLIAKVYTSRYLIFAIPPLILLGAIGLFDSLRFKKFSKLLFLSLLIPLVVSLSFVHNPLKAPFPREMRYGYLEEWTAGWGQKEIGNFLKTKAQEKQKVVVGTEGFFGSLPDGLQIYTQNLPGITVIGGPWPVGEIHESLLNSLKDPQNEVYLVVNKSRLEIPPHQMERLKLIASYDKPKRPDGTNETLLFYQLLRN